MASPTHAAPARVAPAIFAYAVESLRTVHPRQEVEVAELAAPRRLAPFAYALAARVPAEGEDDDIATGRFILLHDPAGQPGWDGTLRLVSYATAVLEPELAADALLAQAAWSWLTDALDAHAPEHHALAGTVSQTSSTGFGQLEDAPPEMDVEVRASWSPADAAVSGHFRGWCAFLATAAGLPPPGVRALPGHDAYPGGPARPGRGAPNAAAPPGMRPLS